MSLTINLNSIGCNAAEWNAVADGALFGSFEADKVSDARVEAQLKLTPKEAGEWAMELSLTGWLQVACDICTEPMRLALIETKSLRVAYGNPDDTDDDCLFVSPSRPIIEADALIRDYALLSIPLRHVCPKHATDETE